MKPHWGLDGDRYDKAIDAGLRQVQVQHLQSRAGGAYFEGIIGTPDPSPQNAFLNAHPIHGGNSAWDKSHRRKQHGLKHVRSL